MPGKMQSTLQEGETLVPGGARVYGGKLDAEQRLLKYYEQEGLTPLSVAATTRICGECAAAVAKSGATAATPLRP